MQWLRKLYSTIKASNIWKEGAYWRSSMRNFVNIRQNKNIFRTFLTDIQTFVVIKWLKSNNKVYPHKEAYALKKLHDFMYNNILHTYILLRAQWSSLIENNTMQSKIESWHGSLRRLAYISHLVRNSQPIFFSILNLPQYQNLISRKLVVTAAGKGSYYNLFCLHFMIGN